jgi:glycosyltransferase involved in cell wall biosynthesis
MRLIIDLQGAQGSSHARGIGRYTRELALAMAEAPRGHDVIVALSSVFPETAADLAASFAAHLPRSQIKIWHPPRDTAAVLGETPLRSVAQAMRAHFLAALKPDLVHVTSMFEGLGDDVTSLQPANLKRLPVVATCYDLIPLVRHHEYFGEKGGLSQSAGWYYRCAHEMAMSEGLLAISESSRSEAIRHLSFSPAKVFDIQSGISPDFQPAPLAGADRAEFLRRYGLRGPFILFLGAGDIRKNEAGLIAAYARLPPALRDSHQLLIVGKMEPEKLHETAKLLNVPADDFVVVPFVPERDLNALYSACALFVFPSLHEGFGLPVAEAMACGAPVIASNTSSLPEVIGRMDATFDPADVDSIAACMRRVLENQVFRDELAAWGPTQAARFTWPSSAARAWDALEAIHAGRQERSSPSGSGHGGFLPARPRLAFVSPFPPQPTGIADYSHDLILTLARHYDITIVTEAHITDERLAASFPMLRPDEFLRQSGHFERVLYQIGNSEFHQFQIETLLPECPGVVVLHDAFLADYASWVAHKQGDPDRFRATLLLSHGYQALRYKAENGRHAAKEKYPCNLSVLQAAIGVIQHSQHGKAILQQSFGAEAAAAVSIIPLLRVARPKQQKEAARALLGLDPDGFVLCSFGSVQPNKCPGVITEAWRRTGLPGRLVFVGGVARDLRQNLSDPKAGISFTGRLSLEQYDLWLAAADLAVQWRTCSRGESSAAIADVLSAGLPLVMNRHGSAAELPEEVALGLADGAGPDDLARAILELHGDAARRKDLADAAQDYALRELSPDVAAAHYRDAIEQAYAQPLALTAAARFTADIRAAAATPGRLASISKALSRSFPSLWRTGGNPRLLIDISELARRDARSGIQRVVREIGARFLEAAPPPYRGAAIRADDGLIWESFAEPLRMLGHDPLDLPAIPLDAGNGDILICADVNAELTDAEFAEFKRLQLEGVRIILVVYDLLPIRHPELFPAAIGRMVSAWYARMLSIADGVACISNAVAQDVAAWLGEDPSRRRTPLPIGSFHLGANFQIAVSGEAESAEALRALADASARPTILMTGTIEPRKGYAQALDAFERLWSEGAELGLTIVGKPGWGVDPLLSRLESSPDRGKRLHWLGACGDATLGQLYRASAGLLMASTNEGFGLPIIEAAHADLPILARDLPVFREVAHEHAQYFRGDSGQILAEALQDWQRNGFKPHPAGIKPLSWDESYRRLCTLILEANWPIVWRPE